MLIPSKRSKGCPSELLLDQLALGELDDAEGLRAHVQGCADCQARVALREGGFSALPPLDEAVVLSRIEAQLRAPEQAPKTLLDRLGFVRRPAFWIPVAAGLALVALRWMPQPSEEVVRMKGRIGLRVYKASAQGAEEVLSGAPLRPQDRLRFKVLTDAPQIMIVGVEAQGERSVYYPIGKRRSAPPRTDVEGALQGAVALDDYIGEERLYLVACQEEFSLEALGRTEPAGLQPPEGCKIADFLIRKRPR